MKREKLLAAAPLALFGLLVVVLVVGMHHRGGDASKFTQHIGDPAPVTDLPVLGGAGARFKTTAWRGRPYIVNFFASWCTDCRDEHEELMTLQASHMPMIGVVFKDKPAKVTAYLDQSGNPYAAVAQDDDGRAGIDWGLTGVPETFVIDARGVIRWHHIGSLTDQIVTDELMPVWENIEHGVNKG
jgi:cytochrome c biogenesis protein CcmG/thiol:disulfide interchange protein DsbE